MTEKEQVQQIVEKYGKDLSKLSEEGTTAEYKAVLKFIADETNRKQRKLAGLEE
ncbi:MAG: hypothetical protein LBI13_06460 [Streptococcaceae bacterium]|jgi:hypothetical protein|nr:hypothetical protein [Streptococcaceae bacterium]